jgi:hypothetical protein
MNGDGILALISKNIDSKKIKDSSNAHSIVNEI